MQAKDNDFVVFLTKLARAALDISEASQDLADKCLDLGEELGDIADPYNGVDPLAIDLKKLGFKGVPKTFPAKWCRHDR